MVVGPCLLLQPALAFTNAVQSQLQTGWNCVHFLHMPPYTLSPPHLCRCFPPIPSPAFLEMSFCSSFIHGFKQAPPGKSL